MAFRTVYSVAGCIIWFVGVMQVAQFLARLIVGLVYGDLSTLSLRVGITAYNSPAPPLIELVIMLAMALPVLFFASGPCWRGLAELEKELRRK